MTELKDAGADRPRVGNETARRRRVLAVAAYRFPHGDAMSNRLLNLVRSAGLSGPPPLVVNAWPDHVPPAETPDVPDGIELATLHSGPHGLIGRSLIRLVRPALVVRAARRCGIGRGDVSAMVLPQGLVNFSSLITYRFAFGCPIVVDVTERHDPTQFRSGRLAPYYLRHRWSAFLTARCTSRATVVSTKLAESLTRRGVEAMVVPPQVDCDDFPASNAPSLHRRVRLVYAGTPGTKDMLNVLLSGIGLLSAQDQERVELVIAGVTADQAATHSDIEMTALRGLDAHISFLGRVPRSQVIELLTSCHFSVLFRPPGGYADAGFPSKVPESLAAGCPVLLNATSDLTTYVTHGREGIFVADCTPTAIREGLTAVLALDDVAWRAMSDAARTRAEESFDYRAFTNVAPFVSTRKGLAAVRSVTGEESR